MLVPLTELLRKAEAGGYAVMAPDFITKHMLELELQVAEAHDTPAIVSYPSLSIDRLRRFGAWTRSVLRLCDRAKVPVCLHLDHGKSVNACLEAIEAGFTEATGVLDGASQLSEENNALLTETLAAVNIKIDLFFETMLAAINASGEETEVIENPEQEVVKLVTDTTE